MKTDFTHNTVEENAQILANYLPNGRLFDAKRIENSNLKSCRKYQCMTELYVKGYKLGGSK